MKTHKITQNSKVVPMTIINTSASGGTGPLILNLGKTWWLSSQLHFLTVLSNGKSPMCSLNRRACSRNCRDVSEKKSSSNPKAVRCQILTAKFRVRSQADYCGIYCEQDRKYMHNVTMKRDGVTTVGMEKQSELHILIVCLYPYLCGMKRACAVLYYYLWPVWLCRFFQISP
jgi:hypothetical protein